MSAMENDKLDIGLKRAVLLAAAFGIDPSLILFPEGYESNFGADVQAVRKAAAKLWAKKKVG